MELLSACLTLLAAFKSELEELYKDKKDEISQLLDNGIGKYIVRQLDKYEKTKTFLFQDYPVDFYKVYYPLALKRRRDSLIVDDISRLFCDGNYVVVVGTTGSGKSMFTKHVFLSSLRFGDYIPIIIEWRSLNSYSDTIESYVKKIIFNHELSKNNNILERILKGGRFLFLFDGFDEISCGGKMQRTSDLNHFIDKYPDNRYLITSRPGVNVESLPRFGNYSVLPLGMVQIQSFIRIQLKLKGKEDLAEEIINLISKKRSNIYNSYLTNPLLLSMFLLTYENRRRLPRSRNSFYFDVFMTLCKQHDCVTKGGGYSHERKTGLRNEDFEKILMEFSFRSFFDGKYEFDLAYLRDKLLDIKEMLHFDISVDDLIDDLTVSISIIIIRDDLMYTFPHRSLQEYFVSSFIKKQNEEKKKCIYKDMLLDRCCGQKNDDADLWQLCNDVDHKCFNEFFVDPGIDNFIAFYVSDNEVLGLIKMLKIGVILDEKGDIASFRIYEKYSKILHYFPDVYNIYNVFVKGVRDVCIYNARLSVKLFDSSSALYESYDDHNGKMNINPTSEMNEMAKQIFKIMFEEKKRRSFNK